MWKYAPQPLWYLPSVLHISLTLFKSIFINVYHNHNLFDKIFWDDLKFVVSITFPVNAFVVFHLSNKRHINKYTHNVVKTHMFILLKLVATFWILHIRNCIFMYGPLMYYFWRCNEITTKGPSVRRRSSIKTSHLNSACILLSMGERHEITWCIM